MRQGKDIENFERLVLPHLNAAYNLACWIMKSEQDAEDAVQEAYLRAFRFFDGFQGEDGRSWLLAIVRNTCRTSLRQGASREPVEEFDEGAYTPPDARDGPEDRLVRQCDIDGVRWCIERLPAEYREVVVLRELEELSYREIAAAIAAPVGTVMSRLARARARLQECLSARARRAGA